jgi:hypothetical protein
MPQGAKMKIQWVICLFVFTAAISGCIGSDKSVKANQTPLPAPTPAPTPAFPIHEPSTVFIKIFGSKFDPPTPLNIAKGTTVKWTNMDSAKRIINLSINGETIQSPELNIRENWSYTFKTNGTFEYSSLWMPTGNIIVR